MKIFREIQGVKTEIYDIEVDNNTELNQKISGQDLIRSRFTSEDEKYDIQIGDFVEFKGIKYTILDEPQVKKEQNTFAYDIQFKSDQYLFNNVQLLNPGTQETEFYLFGDAIAMVSLVISNMNRVYGQTGGTYFADFVEPTEGQNMRFNNVSCLNALDQIANAFNCEFVVKGYQITFRKKIGKETGLIFRYKRELQSIQRQTIQNAELVTVLYAYGSERNITKDYGSKRLSVPKLEKNKDVFGTIERTKIFEDIYPRLNGVVSSASGYRTFTDTGIDFNINDQLIGGLTAKVVFNTGDLAGREYEIESVSGQEISIIPYTDSSDFTTPNQVFKPRVGDKYVLINIEMPQSYIDEAETELQERAQEYIDKFSQPNVIYKVGTHYPELRRQQLDLELGDIVTVVDEDFGIEFETRILGLTNKVNNKFQYTLDIGNQVTVSYFSKVIGDQQDIRNDIYINDKYYNEQFERVFNNVTNLTAPLYVNRGEFDPANYYYNNKNRRDYVYRIVQKNGEEVKEWYYYIGEDHKRAEWILANWELIGDNFEIIATETILAQNANIGKWLIQEGQIVSQATYIDPENANNNTPRVHLNGEEGYIRMASKNTSYGRLGYEEYKETIEMDSRDGVIQAKGIGNSDVAGTSQFSSRGIFSNFAGIDSLPATTGMRAKGSIVGLGFGTLSKSIWRSVDFIAGVIGRAHNRATNPAPAYGGAFWGLKSWGRYVGVSRLGGSGRYDLKEYDEFLSCYNSGNLEIYLPDPSEIPEGREVKVRRNNNSFVDVKGKLFSNQPQSTEGINKGDLWTFLNDGQFWLINVQGRSD